LIYWTVSISRFKKRVVYQTFTIKNFLLFSFHNIVNLLPFSKIALLLWNVQFISAIVFSFARFQDQFRQFSNMKRSLSHIFRQDEQRLFSYIRKIRFAGNASRDILSIGRDCWRAKGIPRGNTRVVISKFEIGSFVRVDRSRKSTTRQSREIKIVGSLRYPEAIEFSS